MSAGTLDLMLLRAAADNELVYDGDTAYGIRWRDIEVDFEMSNRVANLRIDGLVAYEPSGRCPVALTADGERALR